ncbi:hypothetical protein BDW22DRAFT_1427198 [Trametopsis cervina]|nr:hypothetical protein BDW22DRAFT_1427198 [Trametopsis cervina]
MPHACDMVNSSTTNQLVAVPKSLGRHHETWCEDTAHMKMANTRARKSSARGGQVQSGGDHLAQTQHSDPSNIPQPNVIPLNIPAGNNGVRPKPLQRARAQVQEATAQDTSTAEGGVAAAGGHSAPPAVPFSFSQHPMSYSAPPHTSSAPLYAAPYAGYYPYAPGPFGAPPQPPPIYPSHPPATQLPPPPLEQPARAATSIRRGGKGKASAKGRAAGSKGYSDEEMNLLAQTVLSVQPLGPDEWRTVLALYNEQAEQEGFPSRELDALRQKYDRMLVQPKPTGRGEAPAWVDLVHEASEAIQAKAGTRELDDINGRHAQRVLPPVVIKQEDIIEIFDDDELECKPILKPSAVKKSSRSSITSRPRSSAAGPGFLSNLAIAFDPSHQEERDEKRFQSTFHLQQLASQDAANQRLQAKLEDALERLYEERRRADRAEDQLALFKNSQPLQRSATTFSPHHPKKRKPRRDSLDSNDFWEHFGLLPKKPRYSIFSPVPSPQSLWLASVPRGIRPPFTQRNATPGPSKIMVTPLPSPHGSARSVHKPVSPSSIPVIATAASSPLSTHKSSPLLSNSLIHTQSFEV